MGDVCKCAVRVGRLNKSGIPYIDSAFGNNGASTCLNRLGNKWMSICNVAITTERDKYIAFFDVRRMGCNALDIGIISAHPHDIWYVG